MAACPCRPQPYPPTCVPALFVRCTALWHKPIWHCAFSALPAHPTAVACANGQFLCHARPLAPWLQQSKHCAWHGSSRGQRAGLYTDIYIAGRNLSQCAQAHIKRERVFQKKAPPATRHGVIFLKHPFLLYVTFKSPPYVKGLATAARHSPYPLPSVLLGCRPGQTPQLACSVHRVRRCCPLLHTPHAICAPFRPLPPPR